MAGTPMPGLLLVLCFALPSTTLSFVPLKGSSFQVFTLPHSASPVPHVPCSFANAPSAHDARTPQQALLHPTRGICANSARHRGPAAAVVALRCMAQVPERNVLKLQVRSTRDKDSPACDVYLVGTMHYNPVSIQRVADTVDALAQADGLSAVVIESCATRYEKWKDSGADSMQRRFLLSEMQVATDRAKAAGVELILGDQPIEDLGKRTKILLQETLRDLGSPQTGGWARCAEDVWKAGRVAFPSVPSCASFTGLGLRDILDPPLLAGAPVSLFRYPLAWFVRAPVSMLILSFAVLILSSLPDLLALAISSASAGEPTALPIEEGMDIAQRVNVLAQEDPTQVLSAAAGAGSEVLLAWAEIVLFARVFLVALLNDRNEILASKIRSACLRAEAGKSVVAVLGMAHVNGVAQILDQAPPQPDASS